MSLNKVQLIGNVGKDPEVRYLDSGVAVATFPLATTDRAYTLANGTQVPERTEWHNIVLWRGLAETVKRYVTEIFGDNMEMLTPRAAQPAAPAQPQAASPVAAAAQPENNPSDDLPF